MDSLLGRAGQGLPTGALLDFQLDHARARDAVHTALEPAGFAKALARTVERPVIAVRSRAATLGTCAPFSGPLFLPVVPPFLPFFGPYFCQLFRHCCRYCRYCRFHSLRQNYQYIDIRLSTMSQ